MSTTVKEEKLIVETLSPEDYGRNPAGAGDSLGPHFAPEWISYRKRLGMHPLHLVIRENGRVVGSGVAYEHRRRLRPWARPGASLDRLPWMAEDWAGSPDELVDALCQLARQRRWGRLELNSFDGPCPAPSLTGVGWRTSARLEFLWELGPDDGSRLAALKGSHRRKLRKAEKAGVEVVEANTEQGLDELRKLQGSTADRRAERGEAMSCPREDQYRLMAETLLPKAARLFQGRLDGEVVSSILLCLNGTRAYYFLGGTNSQGLRANAATLVMWEASRRLHADGIQRLNLGGVPARAAAEDSPEHGLFRFKDGWGARTLPCLSGTWEAKEARA